MKKKLILIALLFTVSTLIIACPKGKHRDTMRKDKLVSSLNLTDEQRQKFDSIMEEKRASMKASMEVVQTETKAKLAEVLSEEQMQILDDRKAKHKKMKKRRLRGKE